MNLTNLTPADLAGSFLGLVLTLLVFSYIFGDNALFRLAISVFVGAASGYAAVVAWYNVLWPQLVLPLISGGANERLMAAVPLALCLLLLFKASRGLNRLGALPIAYLVGAGAAAAVGGAVMGTLFPQALATINLMDRSAAPGEDPVWLSLASGGVILLGVLATLIYFHYGARPRSGQPAARPEWIEGLGWVGQIFIAVTFGVLFAGVYAAALTALIERIHSIGDLLIPLVFTQ